MVKFSTICQLFERLAQLKHVAKMKLLERFLREYGASDLHSFLRLLLPQIDRVRRNYGMKETNIGNIYAESLQLGKNSDYRKVLQHWNNPSYVRHAEGASVGDFPTVLRYVLRQFSAVLESDLTVKSVNEILGELEACTDREGRVGIFTRLFSIATADEQFWICKIILKDLKIGIGHETVIKHLHPNAIDIFNSTASLEQVCDALRDPSKFEQYKNVNLFSKVRPMLARRCHYDDIEKLMDSKEFSIETKFDGERILCHVDEARGKIMFQTRNAIDYTDLYSPHLGKIILRNVRRNIKCILDGELVVWNVLGNHVEPFGKNKPVDNVFDVLYIGDVDVTSCTYKQRREFLSNIVTPVPRKFEIVKNELGRKNEDAIAGLDKAIASQEEGIIIKRVSSNYAIGERINSWLKLKPDYIDGLGECLDLLILGGFYGEGWKGGRISHFLFGVSVLDTVSDKTPSVFYTFTKAGSGVSRNLMDEIKEKIGKEWKPFHRLRPPPHMANWVAGKDEAPDFWIEPQRSIILEIKAAEIVKSEKFEAGLTLRFPRIQGIREDKDWYECLDYHSLLRMFSSYSGRLAKRKSHLSEYEMTQSQGEESTQGSQRKRARSGKQGERKPVQILESHARYRGHADGVSDILGGKEVCIFPGYYPSPITKASMEKEVIAHGGKIVQNPRETTTFMLAFNDKSLKVRNWIREAEKGRTPAGDKDILSYKWMKDSINAGSVLPIQTRFVIYASKKTLLGIRREYDVYGNSHVTYDTEKTLLDTFDAIDDAYAELMDLSSLPFIETDDSNIGKFSAFFSGLRMYFDVYLEVGCSESIDRLSPMIILMKWAQFYGAVVQDTIDCSTSHVIVDAGELGRLPEIHSRLAELRGSPEYTFEWEVLSSGWIERCIKNRTNEVETVDYRTQ